MRFQILGPLRMTGPRGAVEPAGRLQRVLLAVLLARANQSVAVDLLTDAMWEGRPDPRAPQRLQVHVHKLRRLLDDPGRLSFGASGYRLAVGAGELDLARFLELVDQGAAAEEPATRSELLGQALELWQGLPFDGLDVPLLADESRRLGDRRLAALELRAEAELAEGRHSAAVPELSALVREHPLRERFTWLLMTALHRDGRQVEALDAYRATRATLVEELGLEPGHELRALEQSILAGERAESAVSPAQLPPAVTSFVGRDVELRHLDHLLAGGDDATPMVVVAGTAGVGKTALAVRWAHRARERFPDGQLYVDLRGYGPAEPVAPEDALAGFLRALGVDGAAIPGDLAERSARFRTLVDGRRMVLVLDNARTVEQVRPLLPGTASVAVLVTSRDALAGLVARDGARRIGLDRLTPSASADLLARLAGHRIGGPVAELVELCARLPLALRVAGELVRSRPGRDVARLVAELVDEQRRLDVFDSDDDPHTAVRAVFSWSYQNLADPVARLFRLCGAHPGADVDAYAMAAMAGCDVRTARRALATLVRAHLIEEGKEGRFHPHDLLRAYAAELSDEVDGPGARAAVDRLRDYYLHTAQLANLQVGYRDEARTPSSPSIEAPTLADYHDAARWLDDERANLLAAADPTAPAYVLGLSRAVWRYLDVRGHFDDATALHTLAIRLAREVGDRSAEADAERVLGAAYFRMTRIDDSIPHSERALELYRALGDPVGEGAAANNLAAAHHDANRYQEVIPLCQRSVELLRASGGPMRLASALANLAATHNIVGDYDAAAECLREAVEVTDDVANPNELAYIHHELAFLTSVTGRPREALAHATSAVAIATESGNLTIAGEATYRLGRVLRQLGDHDQALRRQHDAMEIATVTGHPILRSKVLIALGDLCLDDGDVEQARARFQEALAGAHPMEIAAANEGLGDVETALGHHARARDHLRRALATYLDLGVPQAEEVRVKLTRAACLAGPV